MFLGTGKDVLLEVGSNSYINCFNLRGELQKSIRTTTSTPIFSVRWMYPHYVVLGGNLHLEVMDLSQDGGKVIFKEVAYQVYDTAILSEKRGVVAAGDVKGMLHIFGVLENSPKKKLYSVSIHNSEEIHGLCKLQTISDSLATSGGDSHVGIFNYRRRRMSRNLICAGRNYGVKENLPRHYICCGGYTSKNLSLWDTRANFAVLRSKPFVFNVTCLELVPERSQIWVGDNNGAITVMDERKLGVEYDKLSLPDISPVHRIESASFHGLMISAHERFIRVWDLDRLKTDDDDEFHPSSDFLVLGSTRSTSRKRNINITPSLVRSWSTPHACFGLHFVSNSRTEIQKLRMERMKEQIEEKEREDEKKAKYLFGENTCITINFKSSTGQQQKIQFWKTFDFRHNTNKNNNDEVQLPYRKLRVESMKLLDMILLSSDCGKHSHHNNVSKITKILSLNDPGTSIDVLIDYFLFLRDFKNISPVFELLKFLYYYTTYDASSSGRHIQEILYLFIKCLKHHENTEIRDLFLTKKTNLECVQHHNNPQQGGETFKTLEALVDICEQQQSKDSYFVLEHLKKHQQKKKKQKKVVNFETSLCLVLFNVIKSKEQRLRNSRSVLELFSASGSFTRILEVCRALPFQKLSNHPDFEEVLSKVSHLSSRTKKEEEDEENNDIFDVKEQQQQQQEEKKNIFFVDDIVKVLGLSSRLEKQFLEKYTFKKLYFSKDSHNLIFKKRKNGILLSAHREIVIKKSPYFFYQFYESGKLEHVCQHDSETNKDVIHTDFIPLRRQEIELLMQYTYFGDFESLEGQMNDTEFLTSLLKLHNFFVSSSSTNQLYKYKKSEEDRSTFTRLIMDSFVGHINHSGITVMAFKHFLRSNGYLIKISTEPENQEKIDIMNEYTRMRDFFSGIQHVQLGNLEFEEVMLLIQQSRDEQEVNEKIRTLNTNIANSLERNLQLKKENGDLKKKIEEARRIKSM